MLAFAVAIFTSAFLVFQIQPVIVRFILPWYGGTPSVWTTCMLFFQIGLLVGYIYAHLLARYIHPARQAYIHLALVLISLSTLPITPTLPDNSSDNMKLVEILIILGASVGLPFILLSASAPLLQHWFSKAYAGKSPYRLYALSNTGSLLALLSYPFVVEPLLSLTNQTLSWSMGYALFFILCLWCAWQLIRSKLTTTTQSDPRNDGSTSFTRIGWGQRMTWVGLAACGSIMLLAVTNQMSLDVAVIPFLWVLPLSLYLLSFIICFERDKWYKRVIWFPFAAISMAVLIYLLNQAYSDEDIALHYQIAIYSLALFGACMVCHGELVRKRPSDDNLTLFYLFLALGGAVGGVFVNLIAPLIFDGYWELHLVILVPAREPQNFQPRLACR